MSHRRAMMNAWLMSIFGRTDVMIEPASSDASFRRYWRVRLPGRSYILMDAPLGQEDPILFYLFPLLTPIFLLYKCPNAVT